MYPNIVSKRLKMARISLELRQQDVEIKTGIKRDKISKIETGVYEPDLESLGKLIECYNISADWLFGFEILVPVSHLENQPVFRR